MNGDVGMVATGPIEDFLRVGSVVKDVTAALILFEQDVVRVSGRPNAGFWKPVQQVCYEDFQVYERDGDDVFLRDVPRYSLHLSLALEVATLMDWDVLFRPAPAAPSVDGVQVLRSVPNFIVDKALQLFYERDRSLLRVYWSIRAWVHGAQDRDLEDEE